jgi:dTDP-4-dehydrorhamnose reductase
VNILLFGKNGQLGWELQRTLAPLGEVTALDYQELDLEDFDAVRRTVREVAPRLIVNASAYTDVDKAESEPDRAYAINGAVPGILAEEAKPLDAALIHYSTDYVFDGEKGSPYNEEDVPNPLNAYGKSKLAGEEAIRGVDSAYLIFRTAWVYSTRGNSFISKTLAWARQTKTLRIVDDQVSNPTWARMLAETTALLVARTLGQPAAWIAECKGVYHLAGDGYASRFKWARHILALDPNPGEQIATQVLPARSLDFPTPAQRPLFSALDCTCFGEKFGLRLPPWEQSLPLAMGQVGAVRPYAPGSSA